MNLEPLRDGRAETFHVLVVSIDVGRVMATLDQCVDGPLRRNAAAADSGL